MGYLPEVYPGEYIPAVGVLRPFSDKLSVYFGFV